jgi:hypothetical protein
MSHPAFSPRGTGILVLAGLLAACGGGSSTPRLTGVAASGAGIQGTVYLEDALAQERSVATLTGNYAFDLSGLTPPFLLKAVGSGDPLYSFATAPGVANITPLTETIVCSAAGGADLAGRYAAPDATSFASIAQQLPGATAKLRAALQPLLAQYAADVDPFSAVFQPDHTGPDLLLDQVAVAFAGGRVSLTDKASGVLLYNAPLTDLGLGLSNESWSSAQAQAAQDPCVAVTGAGLGLVAWSQSDGGHDHIQTQWLNGTGAAARISSDQGDAAVPRLAFDPSGNALAVWMESNGGRAAIWGNRYDADSGWGTPVRISSASSPGDAAYPDLGVDADGNAVAVWYEGAAVVTNHFDVYASQFRASTGAWSAPVMRSNGTQSAYRPRVAVNGNGAALAVWVQDLGDGSVSNDYEDVLGVRYGPGTGWGTPARLNTLDGSGHAVYAQIATALDAAGNGMALWVQQGSGGAFLIWAAACNASGWQTAASISNDAIDNCYAPDLAFAGPGLAVATWKQQDTVSAFAAANTFSGGAWQTSATPLSSTATGEAYDPHIAVDAAGDATVVWFQVGTDVTIQSNRYLAGSGWGGAQLIGTTGLSVDDVLGSLGLPVAAVGSDAAGQCFVAWGIDPQ